MIPTIYRQISTGNLFNIQIDDDGFWAQPWDHTGDAIDLDGDLADFELVESS